MLPILHLAQLPSAPLDDTLLADINAGTTPRASNPEPVLSVATGTLFKASPAWTFSYGTLYFTDRGDGPPE